MPILKKFVNRNTYEVGEYYYIDTAEIMVLGMLVFFFGVVTGFVLSYMFLI
jgi:hypothetical protein